MLSMLPNSAPEIIECPRDAMQGFIHPVATDLKIRYLQALLEVGFHTLDFGSFVSPKAVPQMADTPEVVQALDLSKSRTRLLAIVANHRGAEAACAFPQISYLGYPFSVSETFQLRNTQQTQARSLDLVADMQALCEASGKTLVVYLSMAFGNPYGDLWSEDIVANWARQIADLGISVISLADTTGVADPISVTSLSRRLTDGLAGVTLGGHFHARPDRQTASLAAAWEGGIRRFDVALGGFGGCPFAQDELVGNVSTEALLAFFKEKTILPALDLVALERAQALAREVFHP